MAAKKEKVAKEPTVSEGTVRAVNHDGVAMLAFGDVVVNEEEPSEFVVSSYHALTTDDALALAADLPTVVQEASAMATHTG